MAELGGYCGYVLKPEAHALHREYHDREYGFPVRGDDDALFERLILEINQAGLSWETVLKKREGFRAAYAGFSISAVAGFGEEDVARLLGDAGIIRNRLKVAAAIHNAQVILGLQEEFGSFEAWLDRGAAAGMGKAEWVGLFKKMFRFTGGEIVGEFLMSLGYLPGAHVEGCRVLEEVRGLDVWWARGG